MDRKSKVFYFRLEPETYQRLANFAEATRKTKAEAIRTAILIASSLFTNREEGAKELSTQGHSEKP